MVRHSLLIQDVGVYVCPHRGDRMGSRHRLLHLYPNLDFLEKGVRSFYLLIWPHWKLVSSLTFVQFAFRHTVIWSTREAGLFRQALGCVARLVSPLKWPLGLFGCSCPGLTTLRGGGVVEM